MALVVDLEDVKIHGNITGTASDAELPSFIATAQRMVEMETGPIDPITVMDEEHPSGGGVLWLQHTPVLTITSLTAAGVSVGSTLYRLTPATGRVKRLVGSFTGEILVSYTAGRTAPYPETILWAIKELTIHLWRSTQAQRGGRSRGEDVPMAASYGLPNRVRDALIHDMRLPAVA